MHGLTLCDHLQHNEELTFIRTISRILTLMVFIFIDKHYNDQDIIDKRLYIHYLMRNITVRYITTFTILGKKCKQDTVVDWLLDIGADTNMLTPKMQSPICILMKSQFTRNTVSILSNLLRHNANPNLGLDNPLCSAAAISIEAVRLLLNAHVDVNKPDIDGNTALVNCLESSVGMEYRYVYIF